MKPDRREWDINVLRECLDEHDVDEVLKLRLSERGEDDWLAWHYETSSGMFTVQSAYKLALQLQMGEAGKR